MAKKLNGSGASHAASLVSAGRITNSASWNPPSAAAEDSYIKANGLGAFGTWHLGVDPAATEGTKGRFAFVFTGDFKTVDYSGLRACITRAGQAGYADIEARARSLYEAAGKKLGIAGRANQEEVRDVPPLWMRAALDHVDAEKRTADVVFSTGARVKRGGFFREPFWEELSLDPAHVRLDRLNNGAPLLAAHRGMDLGSVLGVVEPGTARVDGKEGRATVRFARAADDPEADRIFRKVADGILRNVSVGYLIHKMDRVEKGDPEAGVLPVMRAVDWEPHELSVVPMGADDGAGFRGNERAPTNPCVFLTREEQHMDPEKTETKPVETKPDPTEALAAAAREQHAKETQAAAAAATRAAQQGAEVERQRITTIRRLASMTELGEGLAERLIKANTPVDKAREIVLEQINTEQAARGEISSHVRFEAGEDVREKFIRGGVASILERAGQIDLVVRGRENKRLAEHFKDVAVDPGEFRGMRLLDLARHALEMRGVSTRKLHGEALVRRALELEFRGDQGFNTTSDFAILLETAVNKTFLGAYAAAPVTWPRWCARKSVQDFRTSTFYRPGSFGRLDTVTEAGEVKHKNIPDGEKRTLTPATKGNIIGLTRKAIVNDDLGAFRDLGAGLGQAAAYTVEYDAFALITANSGLGVTYDGTNPLFYSTRANIGPTGAMTITTIDGARVVMAKQKDPSANVTLDLRPAIWLGPVELGMAMRQINDAPYDPTANKFQVPNGVRNLFRDVIDSAYLSASSTTRHYLLADPGISPVFAVGFIDGNEAPRIESEQGFLYDGIQMKVILDYGTAALDYRGAVTCAGA